MPSYHHPRAENNTPSPHPLVDPDLVVVVPASGSFHPRLPRQLYDACPVARRVFVEAMGQPGMPPEPFFFRLYEHSDQQTTPTALSKQERCARMVFLIALYRHFESVHGTAVRPAAVLGNSLGFLTGLVISGSLDLGDAMRLWDFLYEESATKYSERKYCAMMVRGVSPEEIRRHCKLGRPELFYVRPGPVSFLSGPFDRLVKTMFALEQRAGVSATICAGPQAAPFHLRSFRTRRHSIERFMAGIEVREPTVPIYSTVPGRGRVTDSAELEQAMLHTLFNEYRWDSMLEQLAQDGVQRLLCLGFEGNGKLHGGPATPLPVTSMGGVRAAKAAVFEAVGSAKRCAQRQDLLEEVGSWVEGGARRIAIDGYSGAGKTVLSAEIAAFLSHHGRDVQVVSLGAFARRSTLQAFMGMGALPQVGVDGARRHLAELIDYPRLLGFLESVEAIHSGRAGAERLDLGDLTGSLEEQSCNRLVHIARDTIVLVEGNGVVNRETAACFDQRLFLEVDLAGDCDLERLVRRKLERFGRDERQLTNDDVDSLRQKYASSTRNIRRPLMQAHWHANRHRFHYLLDNTELERPLLIRADAAGLGR
jgi:malonyl CoA-acyl carrier protein transacylase